MKTIEVGYTWYRKKYQGSGINKNCKYLLFEFAFEKLGVERIGLGANSKNEYSINAIKSMVVRRKELSEVAVIMHTEIESMSSF